MTIRRLVHRIADALGPSATAAEIEAVAAAALDVLGDRPAAGPAAEMPAVGSVTLGLSLRDCSSTLPQTVRARAYDKIRRAAGHLRDIVGTADTSGSDRIACRIAVTPVALVADGLPADEWIGLARMLDAAAVDVGADAISGFAALVERGMTRGDAALLDSLPAVLPGTERLWASVRCATSAAGTNEEAVRRVAALVPGSPRLVILCNAGPDHPTIDGAIHGPEGPEAALHVSLSPSGLLAASSRTAEPSRTVHAVLAAAEAAHAWVDRCADALSRRSGIPVTPGQVSLAVAGPADSRATASAAALSDLVRAVSRGMDRGPGTSLPPTHPVSVTLPPDASAESLSGLLLDAMADGVLSGRTVVCRVPG